MASLIFTHIFSQIAHANKIVVNESVMYGKLSSFLFTTP